MIEERRDGIFVHRRRAGLRNNPTFLKKKLGLWISSRKNKAVLS